MSLICTTCGSVGESSFSQNDEGGMICDFCGTQSFLQSRHETNDIDDNFGIPQSRGHAAVLRKRKKRGTRAKKKRSIDFVDCLRACQRILDGMALEMVQVCGFPKELRAISREIWFSFLRTWDLKGNRPLFRCFLDYASDKSVAKVLQGDEEQEWDWQRTDLCPDRHSSIMLKTRKLMEFKLRYLLSFIYLACRMLSLGVLPRDIASLVNNGKIEYYSAIDNLPPSLVLRTQLVRKFFAPTTRVNASGIQIDSSFLVYHMELEIPPLNVSLIAHNFITNLGLPNAVFHMFQRLTGNAEPKIGPIVGTTFLHSTVGIVSMLMVAIRLCPSWVSWVCLDNTISEDGFVVPWEDTETILSQHLIAYTSFCRERLPYTRKRPPTDLALHLKDLDQIISSLKRKCHGSDVLRTNEILSFVPLYADGEIVSSDPIFSIHQVGKPDPKEACNYFYPVYFAEHRSFHSAFDNILRRLCNWADVPTNMVMLDLLVMDRNLSIILQEKHSQKEKK